ncbi:MAG: hypothetical protein GSR81_00835 [Desulfurococcales archaeon]|nr:hypothetical protein [Desulfurococcales archaeon]
MSGVVSLDMARFIDKAIQEYNKYRAPESIASLVKIEGDLVYVKFDGSFCRTCGINDWVEDFKFVLEDLGADAELVKVIEPDPFFSEEDWRIGVFRVRSLPKN